MRFFSVRAKHGDHYHIIFAEAPDELTEKLKVILGQNYYFVVENIDGRFDVMTVEREGHEVELAVIRTSEEYGNQVAKLIERTYDLIVHDTHEGIGLNVIPRGTPAVRAEAADATPTPFTPFDTEGATNDDGYGFLDDLGWSDRK